MKNLFSTPAFMAVLAGLLISRQPAPAQGTTFTYQGRLNTSGNPANGNYDFTFMLFNNSGTNTGQVGSTQTYLNIGVTNGLFTLPLDFGVNFPGASRWLAIGVRTNGSASFTALSPSQALTPTPYAIYAPNAGSAATATNATSAATATTASNVASGITITNAAITNSVFSGNAGGLTNLNASQLTTGIVSTSVLPGFQSNSNYSTVSGGQGNSMVGASQWATIAGGNNNTNFSNAGTIAGGQNNNLAGNWHQPAIGGGFGNNATANYATIPGGINNIANGTAATASGFQNQALNGGAVVSGGGNNVASGLNSSVGGGSANQATQQGSAIGGGYNNTNTGIYAAVGGGSVNIANNEWATIAGGNNNTNGSNAGTIAGGQNNLASGQYQSTVGGGYNNRATTSYATVPGGINNIASGEFSLAAGQQAQATNQGAFVWADSSNAVFASTTSDQFSVRANGGARFVTGGTGLTVDDVEIYSHTINDNSQLTVESPIDLELQSDGIMDLAATASMNITAGGGMNISALDLEIDGISDLEAAGSMSINGSELYFVSGSIFMQSNYFSVGGSYCDGTTWVNGSDRNSKEDFTAVNPRQVLDKVLALPITEWKYKVDTNGNRHLGPMAQDFHAAFSLNGGDDKHISTVDEGGVALAAIQGLNEKLNEKDTEIQSLKKELAEQKAINQRNATRFDQLEKAVAHLANPSATTLAVNQDNNKDE